MLVICSGLGKGGTGEGTAVAGVATAKSSVGYGRIVALGSGVDVAVGGETAVTVGDGVVALGVGLEVVVGTAVAEKGWFVAVGKSTTAVGVGASDGWQAVPSRSTLQKSR